MANGEVSYAIRSYTLGAGEVVRIDRHSGFLACLASTDVFKVAFDDGEENDFEAGITYSPIEGFRSVQIRNDGASTNTVKLGFGKGNIKDARLNLAGSIANREEVPDYAPYLANVTFTGVQHKAVSTAPNLSLVKGCLFQNEGPSVVYIHKNGIWSNAGHKLEVGATVYLEGAINWNGSSDGDAIIRRIRTEFSS